MVYNTGKIKENKGYKKIVIKEYNIMTYNMVIHWTQNGEDLPDWL